MSKLYLQHLEETSLNAWPALNTLVYDGWILRMSNGYTKRANSVTPLYRGHNSLTEKINHCIRLYHRCHLPPIFRVPSFVSDAALLDKQLADKGYTRFDETIVMTMPLEPRQYQYTPRMFELHWPDLWVPLYHEMDPSRKDAATHEEILNRIMGDTSYMTIRLGDPIACGLGVCEAGYLGLFDIVVQSDYRGKGFGRELVQNLLAWGEDEGAKHAYLQVTAKNSPAIALYTKLGFQESYRYWYWIHPSDQE
ncbi:MAG: GNAT family N-acetyltransferase [Chloroflexota bacterium]